MAAASATYWVLKWSAAAPPSRTAALVIPSAAQIDTQGVARLLGGGQIVVAAAQVDSTASRFKLTGVVANRAKGGYAVISIDGKPAQPYRVGVQVNDTLVLQSVAPRSAALAASLDAPVSFTLEMPSLTRSEGKVARSSSE